MDHGRVVASGTQAELYTAHAGEPQLSVEFLTAPEAAALHGLPLACCAHAGRQQRRVHPAPPRCQRGLLAAWPRRGLQVRSLASSQPSLEDVFLALTGQPTARLTGAAMNAAAFLSLLRAELRLFLANRKAMVMSIVAPILIAAFFGSSLFGGSGQSKPAAIPIAVVDLDQSALSAAVVKALQADGSLKTEVLPEPEAIAQVRAGKRRRRRAAGRLGQQASTALFGAGRKPEIQLHYDPPRP